MCIKVYIYGSAPVVLIITRTYTIFEEPIEEITKINQKTYGKSLPMAATSVVVLDRGNNTTCTINLHGKF